MLFVLIIFWYNISLLSVLEELSIIDRAAPSRPELNIKKEFLALGYESFGDSQGDQALQTYFVQTTIRRMVEAGHSIDPMQLAALESRMGTRPTPDWHKTDDFLSGQIKAQFRFWWRNILIITSSIVHQDPYLLPDRAELEQQAWEVGGSPEMSSFKPHEFDSLDQSLEPFRRTPGMSSSEVITELLVPRLIKVETGWQVGEKSERHGDGRPRADNSDPYESVWLHYGRDAQNTNRQGRALTHDQIYLDIARYMEVMETTQPDTPLVQDYLNLMYLYNLRHPDEQVAALYR